jgi:hypothetical protein
VGGRQAGPGGSGRGNELAQFSGRTFRRVPEQSGTAAKRANFGPDYQSPSHASLLSRRTGAPGRVPLRHISVTLEETNGLSGIIRPHLSRKSFGTPRRTAMMLTASHLASPLGPGRGVLIRSVSRRLGSVAYVREDASPNEVSCLQPPSACRREPGVSNWRAGQADEPVRPTGNRCAWPADPD